MDPAPVACLTTTTRARPGLHKSPGTPLAQAEEHPSLYRPSDWNGTKWNIKKASSPTGQDISHEPALILNPGAPIMDLDHLSFKTPRTPDQLAHAGRRHLHLLTSSQSDPHSLTPYTRISDFQSSYAFRCEEDLAKHAYPYGRHGGHRDAASRDSDSCGLPKVEFWRLTASMKPKKHSTFSNLISTDGSVLVAQSNFKESAERMHWSEIVTYCVAIRSRMDELRKGGQVEEIGEIGERQLAAIGKVRRIIRSNISNHEWRVAKEEVVLRWMRACRRDHTVVPRVTAWWDDVWIELKPGTEAFEMMAGTPNGVGVVYLLAHNRGRFPEGIAIEMIRINPKRPVMEFLLQARGEFCGEIR